MSKADFVAYIANEVGITKTDAEKAYKAFVTGTVKSVKEEGKVRIPGLGTFTMSRREAREGRNPKTGETVQIAARNAVSFKAANEFKEELN